MIKVVKRNLWNPIWLIWYKILFRNANPKTTYFGFGKLMITPNGMISNDLYIHEKVHLEQQKYSYIYGLWWYICYIFSQKFRLKMEIPAYGEQIKSIKQYKHNTRVKMQVASLLKTMYKIDMSEVEIYSKLTEYVNKN